MNSSAIPPEASGRSTVYLPTWLPTKLSGLLRLGGRLIRGFAIGPPNVTPHGQARLRMIRSEQSPPLLTRQRPTSLRPRVVWLGRASRHPTRRLPRRPLGRRCARLSDTVHGDRLRGAGARAGGNADLSSRARRPPARPAHLRRQP